MILICFSLGTLCGWLMRWLGMTSPKPMILVSVLSAIFVFAILRQVRRTHQYTRQFLYFSDARLPKHVQSLLVELGIKPSDAIVLEATVPFVFCFGFLHPRICLSTGLFNLLSKSQLRAVLCHEDYHRRRFDPLRILLIEAISTTLFLLPAVREWQSLVKIKLELAADEYAIGIAGKSALAGALHGLLTCSSELRSMQGIAIAGLSANTARVAAVLGERIEIRPISRRSLAISVAVIWGICCLLFI